MQDICGKLTSGADCEAARTFTVPAAAPENPYEQEFGYLLTPNGPSNPAVMMPGHTGELEPAYQRTASGVAGCL